MVCWIIPLIFKLIFFLNNSLKEKFDYDVFDEKVQQNYEEYEGELQHTNDKKGIALLQTKLFSSCLKDAMESILHSSKARKIPSNSLFLYLKKQEYSQMKTQVER